MDTQPDKSIEERVKELEQFTSQATDVFKSLGLVIVPSFCKISLDLRKDITSLYEFQGETLKLILKISSEIDPSVKDEIMSIIRRCETNIEHLEARIQGLQKMIDSMKQKLPPMSPLPPGC